MEQKNNNQRDNHGGFQQFDNGSVYRKRSRFLAVLFGFCPGAGHMYLGKINRGLTLMAIFFANIAVGVIFPPVFFLLPLVWFYAFFDCLNLSALPPFQLDAMPDELGFGNLDQLNLRALKEKLPAKTGGKLFGWALILVGGYMLYELVTYHIIDVLESFFWASDLWWLRSLINEIPQIILSVVIILFGIHLIKGSHKRPDDVPRYRSGDDAAASVMELIRAKAVEHPENEPVDALSDEVSNDLSDEETVEKAEDSAAQD